MKDTPPSSYRRFFASGAAWLGLFFVNALGILPWARMKFPVVDLAEMVYEVRRLQLGYVPYRDTFTHHFVGYIIPFWLVGLFVPLTPIVLKAATLCFNFGTAVIVYLILREIANERIGWLGAFLTVTIGWFWRWQGYGFNVQSYIVPVVSLMLLLIVRAGVRESRGALIGSAFFAGLLSVFDQRAIVFLAFPAIALVFVPAFRQRALWLRVACAAIIVPGICAIYLWRAGALPDFLEQTLVFPLRYRNRGLDRGSTPFVFSWFAFWIRTETIPVLFAIAGLIALLIEDRRRWLKVLWLMAVAAAAAYSIAGGRLYPNYFLIGAPVVLVLTSLLVWFVSRRSAIAGVVIGAIVVGLGCFTAIKSVVTIANGQMRLAAEGSRTVDIVADYVRAHTDPEDGVLVWGFAPQIYVLSDRFRTFKDAGLLSVAGANFSSISSEDQGTVPHMVREFDAFLTSSPPKVIVYHALTRVPCYSQGVIQRNFDFRQVPSLINLRRVLDESYHVDLVVDGPCDRAEVFVRDSSRH